MKTGYPSRYISQKVKNMSAADMTMVNPSAKMTTHGTVIFNPRKRSRTSASMNPIRKHWYDCTAAVRYRYTGMSRNGTSDASASLDTSITTPSTGAASVAAAVLLLKRYPGESTPGTTRTATQDRSMRNHIQSPERSDRPARTAENGTVAAARSTGHSMVSPTDSRI